MIIAEEKLVKWQKFKTAICDLTKKTAPVEFLQNSRYRKVNTAK